MDAIERTPSRVPPFTGALRFGAHRLLLPSGVWVEATADGRRVGSPLGPQLTQVVLVMTSDLDDFVSGAYLHTMGVASTELAGSKALQRLGRQFRERGLGDWVETARNDGYRLRPDSVERDSEAAIRVLDDQGGVVFLDTRLRSLVGAWRVRWDTTLGSFLARACERARMPDTAEAGPIRVALEFLLLPPREDAGPIDPGQTFAEVGLPDGARLVLLVRHALAVGSLRASGDLRGEDEDAVAELLAALSDDDR